MSRLKKSLGQHFLKDENIARRIVESLQEDQFQRLLEVGPGGGALTKYLIQIPGIEFKAVELDEEKSELLIRKFPSLQDRIIIQDFLTVSKPFDMPFNVIGNFPYNISTQILFKILEWRESVPYVIGMFQKEVAERAASREGSKVYGVLSVLVQYYYRVEYLFDVGREAFNPPPKVNSAIIRLSRLPQNFPVRSETAFRLLVKAAFGQRRKTLRNAVKGFFSKEFLSEQIFDRRAETLSVEEFATLTFKMNQPSNPSP